jgi:hypothetical protein
MSIQYRIILFTLLFFNSTILFAQRNITGVWEGIMEDELLQINVQQKGDSLCGYTYDYILDNKINHCRARFTGYYNADKKAWFFSGTSFIENVGGHILMRLRLMKLSDDSYDELTGWVATKGIMGVPISDPEGFKLRRVSNQPYFEGYIEPCFPVHPKKRKGGAKPAPVAPPKPKVDTVRKATSPIAIKKDTVARKPLETKKPAAKAPSDILKVLNSRKNTEQSRLVIDDDHINLKLYDNGTVDGDSVSVFYNGRLLVNNKRLSEQPIELNIDLDTTVLYHEITLFANNLGSIPPNTALIIATAGGKRYELRSKASLEENAVLIFEYRKKEK